MTNDNKNYFFGVGRRKTSIARVRIIPGKREAIINGKKEDIKKYQKPFEIVGELDKFGLSVKVNGGGKISQIDAVIHGISRALEKYNDEYRTALKKAGLLKRDPREKERKKPGRRKARKSPQWSKR